jgi:hypothetical protein
MFEGLNWGNAFKRGAIFTGIWLGLVYVLHTINPELFRLGSRESLFTLALNAVLFFFLYATFFAFMERRRNRLRAEAKGKKEKAEKPSKAAENGEAPSEGTLKGQRNPNTSRKKATRRRR